eukprot:COSAG01_NODE_65684_length_272_cov_1.184971_1_plen_58_part_01
MTITGLISGTCTPEQLYMYFMGQNKSKKQVYSCVQLHTTTRKYSYNLRVCGLWGAYNG